MTQSKINKMKLVRPRLIKISMMVVSIVVNTLVQGNINSSSMSPHLFPGTNVSGKDEGCTDQESKDEEADQVSRHT